MMKNDEREKGHANSRFEIIEDPFYSVPMLIGWSLHELSDIVNREGNIGFDKALVL